jgi:1,2-dihydroxy-3-keto-5-methylthiopentene dioxygenase
VSKLWIYPDNDPSQVLLETSDPVVIASILGERCVRFEQWRASKELPADASQDDILTAYRADIARLSREGGYASADVVRLRRDPSDPTWPEKARAARQKFLEEHTHNEDEVRFFVEGSGIFYLRLNGQVHAVLCERGDLISVCAGTRHWFDMGTEPHFCAIRLFGTPNGWVASFTGDTIAQRFPSFDALTRGGEERR